MNALWLSPSQIYQSRFHDLVFPGCLSSSAPHPLPPTQPFPHTFEKPANHGHMLGMLEAGWLLFLFLQPFYRALGTHPEHRPGSTNNAPTMTPCAFTVGDGGKSRAWRREAVAHKVLIYQ